MKTYDEMKENVFRRIEDIEAEKKRKRKIYTRTAAAVAPLCAAGAAVFTLWGGGAFGKGTDAVEVLSLGTVAEAESRTAAVSESIMTVRTHTTLLKTDSTAKTVTEKAEATSVHEVQPDTEEKSDEEEMTTAESTTAPRATTGERNVITNSNDVPTATTAVETPTAPPANLWCISVSSISYNGTDYHDSTVNISAFTQDRYIGRVSDFAGSYGDTVNYRINSGDSVYTVKETPDLLLVVKADSSSIYGSVIPMCSSSFSGDSYGYGSLVPNLTIPDGAVIN
ncbi:hypothetical protein [Ruminococcus sp.]|uniref:hypothetical protein n=1 Tax=Ruminococcus sp. TaxID=41978 RepID=UPI0025E3B8C6|nr:hypothetical protein [Ruminococcus sp.]MBR1432425.1 hypothetical protein [Ruminococcus sp.]MBR1824467.1 hypothetical protein [Ruminococcus sp.]